MGLSQFDLVLNVIFLCLFLICLLTTSVSLFSVLKEKTNLKQKVSDELSVYCEDLSLSPDEDEETFNVEKSNIKQTVIGYRYICSSDNATKLIDKFVQRAMRLKLAKGEDTRIHYLSCGNSSLAPKSGYLSVTFTRISSKTFEGQGRDGIVYWDIQHPSSYKWPTFSYENGGVTVTEMREYYVFVTVMFHVGDMSVDEKQKASNPHQLYVRVCLERYGHETIVVQTTDQINITEPRAATSLHIGSHVLLRKGDIVRVRASDPRRLAQDSKGNAFGLIPSI